MTRHCVITNTKEKIKFVIVSWRNLPMVSINDPLLMLAKPAGLTAATGMDVLTHAVEAYTSRQANAFSSIYAEHAMRYVFTYLQRTYRCMDDMEAREMMQLGSCMAGMAFNNSGLGITHSIAHSLGGLFHIAHGLANAVMLPHVIRFNSFDVGVKYRAIAEILGLPCASVEEGTTSLIQAVRDMNDSMGIPARLSTLKIEEARFLEHLDAMAGKALADFCTGGNPRRPSAGDIKMLLEQAW